MHRVKRKGEVGLERGGGSFPSAKSFVGCKRMRSWGKWVYEGRGDGGGGGGKGGVGKSHGVHPTASYASLLLTLSPSRARRQTHTNTLKSQSLVSFLK